MNYFVVPAKSADEAITEAEAGVASRAILSVAKGVQDDV